jgi:SAM-dependent methyltransferase
MSYNDQAGLWIKHARGKSGFYEFLERPAMRSLLPESLNGQSVLCLGVGSGEETEIYEQLGAESIVGVDNSPKLITAAGQRYPQHDFRLMDLNDLQLKSERYDVVGSHMVMHYGADWRDILDRVHAALKPGGVFVFSTHNPVWWSAEKVEVPDGFEWVVGVRTNHKDHSQKVLGTYLGSTNLRTEIFKGFEVEFYHRPFGEMIQTVLDSDFLFESVLEPKPIAVAKKEDPRYYQRMRRLTPLVCFKLRRSS